MGDSITYGYGLANPAQDAYPAVLQRQLGSNFLVENFGAPGATLLQIDNFPFSTYQRQPAFQAALQFKPDVVTVLLGTNDAEQALNPARENEFVTNYNSLIAAFKTANSKVKIYLCLPPPCFLPQSNRVVNLPQTILPLIRQVALQASSSVVDLYTPLLGKPGMFLDGLHPNRDGARLIALQLAAALQNTSTSTSAKTTVSKAVLRIPHGAHPRR